MIQKWFIRFICFSILCFFVFSAASTCQLNKKKDAHPFITTSPFTPFQKTYSGLTSSSMMMSGFHNIGYEISETDGMIRSVGLCMEFSIDHMSSFSSSSVVVSTYDKQGNFLNDDMKGLEDIDFLYPFSTNDGNYIACGGISKNDVVTESYPVLIKFDENLEVLWQKDFLSFSNGIATSLSETNDGGYIIAGQMSKNRETDDEKDYIILLKTDDKGIVNWEKTIEFNGLLFQRKIIQTEDDGFVFIGNRNQNSNDPISSDIYIMKTDNMGTVEWNKTINYSVFDYASDLLIDSGNIIITGFTANQTGPSDYDHQGLIYCVDNNGKLLWSHHKQFQNRAFYGIEKSDDGFLVTGYETIYSRGIVMKIDESGMSDWEVSTSGIGVCCGMDVKRIENDLICFTGYTLPIYDSMPDFQYFKVITVGVNDQGTKQWEQMFAPSTILTSEYIGNTWLIQNNGDVGAYNLSFKTTISGNIFAGGQKQQKHLQVIFPGETTEINIPFMCGLGKVSISLRITGLNIAPVNTSIDGFLLGPFFFSL